MITVASGDYFYYSVFCKQLCNFARNCHQSWSHLVSLLDCVGFPQELIIAHMMGITRKNGCEYAGRVRTRKALPSSCAGCRNYNYIKRAELRTRKALPSSCAGCRNYNYIKTSRVRTRKAFPSSCAGCRPIKSKRAVGMEINFHPIALSAFTLLVAFATILK